MDNKDFKFLKKPDLEEMKNFTREKLYIEHCLPEEIRGRHNEKVAKIFVFGAITVASIISLKKFFKKKKRK